MKKQFTMIPNMFASDVVQVTKYVDGTWKEGYGVLFDEVEYVKKKLESEGWIYSIDVNHLQEQIKEYNDKIGSLLQTIEEAMEAGNYILEHDD